MFRPLSIVIALLAPLLVGAQQLNYGYAASCVNGQVAAKKSDGKVLVLRIGGEKPVPCQQGTEIKIEHMSEPKTTSAEGVIFSALTTVKQGSTTLMIASTFQERPFPRKKGQTL